MPLLFIFWQNYQNSMYLGFFLFAAYILTEWYYEKNSKLLVLMFSTLFILLFAHIDSYRLHLHFFQGMEFEKYYPVMEHQAPLDKIYALFYWYLGFLLYGLYRLWTPFKPTLNHLFDNTAENKTRVYNTLIFFVLLIVLARFRRGIPFFMLATIPLAIFSFQEYFSRFTTRQRTIWSLLFMVCIIISGIYLKETPFSEGLKIHPALTPDKAIEFIQKKNPPGEMMNPMNSAGYLIWKFENRKKVFWDARTSLNLDLVKEWSLIRNASPKVIRQYFEQKNVTYVLFDLSNENRENILHKNFAFLPSSLWATIYMDSQFAIVMRKNCSECADFISKNTLK